MNIPARPAISGKTQSITPGLVRVLFFLFATTVAFGLWGCEPPGALRPTDFEVDEGQRFVAKGLGAIDEVVGPNGEITLDFSDADYVQLQLTDAVEPIYDPTFVPAGDAGIPDNELIIGLEIGGDARAYPAGILYHREMINDVVGGVPVLVSWCPLCYAAMVHDRRLNGSAARFGNQGALYKGAMTWYDHDTGSVWSQPLGQAIAGPRADARLETIPAQLTTWSNWIRTMPHSLVLTDNRGHQDFKGRLPGPDHVAGVTVDGSAVAWSYPDLLDGRIVSDAVSDVRVALWQDRGTGGMRAASLTLPNGKTAPAESAPRLVGLSNGLRELPVIIAYRSSWLRIYPGAKLNPVNPTN